MSPYKKFVKDLGLIGFVQLLVNLKGIFLLPLITKLLGAKEFGIWTQSVLSINLLSLFMILGLHNALLRFLPASKTQKEIQQQVWSLGFFILGLSLLAAFLLFIFASPVSGFLKIPTQFVVFISLILIFKSVNVVFIHTFQALQEAGMFSSFLFIQEMGELLFVALAIILGYGIQGAVLALLTMQALLFLILIGVLIKKIGFLIPDFSVLREYLRFSLPTLISAISYRIVQTNDHYFIGVYLGILFVGYYAPAYSLGNLPNMIAPIIGIVLPPLLAKLFAEAQLEEIKKYLSYTMKYFMFVLIPATFFLAALSKSLLVIFSTPEIAEQSALLVPFIALAFLLYGAYAVFSQVLGLYKKTYIIGIVWAGAAAINVVLNLLFIPSFGMIVPAVATLLAFAFATAATWYYAFKDLPFPIDFKNLAKSAAAALLVALFLFLLQPTELFETLFALALGGLVYGALLLAMKAFEPKEVQFFLKLLQRS